MQWQGIKIHMIFVALCLALTAFLGTHWLYNSLNFREPLKKVLDNNNMVTEYRIEDAQDSFYQVTVTIKEAENMMLAYQQVYKSVEEVMGNHQFIIKLVDNRDNKLENLYQQGQFAIQEALVQGNFQDMADVLNESASQAGVESKVFIDADNIYWQMSYGEHYLYEVIPRTVLPDTLLGNAAEGRGLKNAERG